MNTFSKYLLILTTIFLILVVLTNLNLVNAEIESGVIVNGSKYTDEPIEIQIDKTGSKNYYSIDNSVGAKNKIVSKENKDYYEINHYLKEDGTIIELIYPNGKQNNADKNLAIVNGSEVKQPRIFGKDGITYLTIVYDEYLHSEETVNFNNPIGDRYTSITNNLGRGDSWSNNGVLFNNQISGLEFVMGENGNYTFKYWIDDFGEVVNSFNIGWLNGAVRSYNFTTVYDFVPNPEPVNHETNVTNNETNENTTNNNSNDNITNITLPINNSNNTNINLNNSNSTMQDNKTTLTNKEKTNNTTVALNKKTGISFYSLVGIVLLVYMLVYFKRRYN